MNHDGRDEHDGPRPDEGVQGREREEGHDAGEGHHGSDAHDRYDLSGYRMRRPSPLSPEAEAAMTRAIDCAMAVHRALGPGYLESIYRKAMCIALAKRGIRCAQVISYLKSTGLRGGLLINFRVPLLYRGLQRIVL